MSARTETSNGSEVRAEWRQAFAQKGSFHDKREVLGANRKCGKVILATKSEGMGETKAKGLAVHKD